MVGRGKYREGQGQGLPLLPGKTLWAGANGFQTQGLEAPSPSLLSYLLVWDLVQRLGEMVGWGSESYILPIPSITCLSFPV